MKAKPSLSCKKCGKCGKCGKWENEQAESFQFISQTFVLKYIYPDKAHISRYDTISVYRIIEQTI